jgi:hypothetical protein
MKTRAALLVLVTVVGAGCAAPAASVSESVAPSAVTPVASQAEPEASPSAAPSVVACPHNDSPCLGPIAAGTYHTSATTPGFWFPFEYTVPEGWDNIEDYPNAFDLRYTEFATDGGWDDGGLTAGIAVFVDMGTAPADDPCGEVGPRALSTDEWVELLTNDPDLVVTEPQPITVGGFEGVTLSVAISPDYTGTCFFDAEFRSKGFLVQIDFAGVHRMHTEYPQHVIFLDAPDGWTITILVEDRFPLDAYEEFWTDYALPVIESIEFDGGHF